MPSRLSLPLWVPVLMLAAGCVTVRPTPPVEAPRQDPAAARTAWTPRPPVVPGLPLGPAPEPQDMTGAAAHLLDTGLLGGGRLAPGLLDRVRTEHL
ncbi:hypothetical protein AB0F18_38780, partial [Streptomyces sp. NPDC029216]